MQRRSALDGESKVRGPGPPDTHCRCSRTSRRPRKYRTRPTCHRTWRALLRRALTRPRHLSRHFHDLTPQFFVTPANYLEHDCNPLRGRAGGVGYGRLQAAPTAPRLSWCDHLQAVGSRPSAASAAWPRSRRVDAEFPRGLPCNRLLRACSASPRREPHPSHNIQECGRPPQNAQYSIRRESPCDITVIRRRGRYSSSAPGTATVRGACDRDCSPRKSCGPTAIGDLRRGWPERGATRVRPNGVECCRSAPSARR
jgi:hypothetical protein